MIFQIHFTLIKQVVVYFSTAFKPELPVSFLANQYALRPIPVEVIDERYRIKR